MPLENSVPNNRYRRTVEELRKLASMFWPAELSERAAQISIIPKLLETQDQFITLLGVDIPDIDALFNIIDTSKLSGNMFVKHLVVLSDFGGEMLQRINTLFDSIFPRKQMRYFWNEEERIYNFKRLPIKGVLSNDKLGISGKKLLDKQPLSELHRDVVAILLFGGAATSAEVSEILSKCEVSAFLGKPDELAKYIKQRYIWVSRITGGAQANTLGQFAQNFVKEYLEKNLNVKGTKIHKNAGIPGVSHTDELTGRPTKFDLVLQHGAKKYVAIEVSFQVTTNSTIERKAGQARARFEQIDQAGHRIAYVIDGAGNFQRENAIGTICSFSHCTVAFSRDELEILCEYIRDFFGS